jgi:hypothetical protein
VAQLQDEFRIGKRSVLRKGDLFRASGGPMYEDQQAPVFKARIGRPGIYRFISYLVQRKRGWINCKHVSRLSYETLYVTGPTYRSPAIPGVVNRPYRVTGIKKPRERR